MILSRRLVTRQDAPAAAASEPGFQALAHALVDKVGDYGERIALANALIGYRASVSEEAIVVALRSITALPITPASARRDLPVFSHAVVTSGQAQVPPGRESNEFFRTFGFASLAGLDVACVAPFDNTVCEVAPDVEALAMRSTPVLGSNCPSPTRDSSGERAGASARNTSRAC